MPPDPDLTVFDRYRPIVSDWDAFTGALRRPLPLTFWAHPTRIEAGHLLDQLADEGARPEPLGWLPGAWRLPAEARLGGRWEFFAGLYFVQEETSLMPVELLGVEPGHRVLDLCAAPGGKTARLALAMQNRGTLVANELNWKRLKGLRQTCERLGLVNVSISYFDGTSIPWQAGGYDRILVDAPCSCEGTSRKEPGILRRCGEAFSLRQAGAQRALLRKAVQLCRPGGRIVYCTCTYAPEENELVVEAILREYPEFVRLLPARLPGVELAPGITEWDTYAIRPEMALCGRVWPHQRDTGGFFMALLEKTGDPTHPEPPPSALEPADPAPFLGHLAERFGIPASAFEGLQVVPGEADELNLLAGDHVVPTLPTPWHSGLFALRSGLAAPKLSVPAALAFGHLATRNVVPITETQAHRYLERDLFPVEPEQVDGATPGYVILTRDAIPMGVGLLLQDERCSLVRSQFPKRWLKTRRG